MQENRLAKAEAKLSGRQRVLAWMHRRQQLGGFVEMLTRNLETKGASGAAITIEDWDAAFVFECVVQCNLRALELNEAHLEKGLLSLCLSRLLNTSEIPAEEWQIKAFRRALKTFVLKWRLFDRTVQTISDEQFSGMRILYDDTAAMLEKDIKDAQRLCDVFNDDIAPAFRVEPITPEEIEEYLQAAAQRDADKVTSLARAKAELSFGSRYSACAFVIEAIRSCEAPENLRHLLGAVDGR